MLGYSLNTVPGLFFGSETRRLFDETKETICDACGNNCRFWNADLRKAIHNLDCDNLDELYNLFRNHNPMVDIYVDGSKTPLFYKNKPAHYNIVSMKHPIRLIASHLYNDRKKRLHSAKASYDDIREVISDTEDDILKISSDYFVKIERMYRSIFSILNDNRFDFRVDLAHCNDFRRFRDLESYLELEENSIKERSFTQVACHSIGGNRAPAWLSRQKNVANLRMKYYSSQRKFGDWKIDNKYQLLLTQDVISQVSRMDTYKQLVSLMGYECVDIDIK